MLEMIRISKNGYSWADIWIPEGCFGIYEKKYRQQGYDVKKTLVKKETELERKSTMSKFDSITCGRRENLLMETAMRIQEVFDDMWAAKLLDPDKIGATDSIERLQTFCKLAREFENAFYGTDEYDDFIGLTEEWATKKLKELYGIKKDGKSYLVTIASYEYRTARIDDAKSPEEAVKIAEEMLDSNEREFINDMCSDIYDYGTYVCDEVVELDN